MNTIADFDKIKFEKIPEFLKRENVLKRGEKIDNSFFQKINNIKNYW